MKMKYKTIYALSYFLDIFVLYFIAVLGFFLGVSGLSAIITYSIFVLFTVIGTIDLQNRWGRK
jgi:hypothetical protein